MDITLLIALAAVTLVIILSIALFFNSKRPPKLRVQEQRAGGAVPRVRDGAPRRAQAARNRGVRMRANARLQQEESDEENEAPERETNVEFPEEKIGAKKRAKLEAKAEKKAQREAEEQQRQEKKRREKQIEEERRKSDEKRQAEEKRVEEEERKLKEEKDRKEYEEYLKMKQAFSVEEEGFEEGEESGQQNLLQEFVNYIKANKVVVIEDLAAHFKLKTQATIDRIQDLQKDDILTGVMDDRGKFIYVSSQEMEAVAKFIKQRGRVSIAELAECSNQLINLTPTAVN